MPRRREVPKRDILPDPKFGSVDLSKFVNVLMSSGKKSVAERIIYGAFAQIQSKSGKDPLEVFALAVNNVKPMVEVKSRRVGGANYQVPVEVRPARRMAHHPPERWQGRPLRRQLPPPPSPCLRPARCRCAACSPAA